MRMAIVARHAVHDLSREATLATQSHT